MKYRVVVQPCALQDLDDAFSWAAGHAPETAWRWLERFQVGIAGLARFPLRCGYAPENDLFEPEIRQYLFGRRSSVFRVLFTVRGEEVHVLHIRRATMSMAKPEDLGL